MESITFSSPFPLVVRSWPASFMSTFLAWRNFQSRAILLLVAVPGFSAARCNYTSASRLTFAQPGKRIRHLSSVTSQDFSKP
jgi:hypothetical protein